MSLDNPKNSLLFKKLEGKNPKYSGLIEKSWEVAEKSLRTIPAIHPTYTSHGPDHALALLRILDRALEPLGIDLNEEELYILISATLLHDIGMVGKIDTDESNRNRIRSEHHLRSKAYILDNYNGLYIERKFKKQIAEAASAHRKLNIDEHIIERKIGDSNLPSPRLKFIAALLRMADECHITEDRIPEDYGILDLPEESLEHFQQHFNSIGREFDQNAGEIKFTVEIANEEIDKLFKLAKTKIQKELDELQVIFKRHNVPYSKINFIEDREELIRHKIIKTLLSKGPLTKNSLIQLLKEQGEEETSVTAFLDVSGEYEPFELIHENGQELYQLLCSEKVFYDLANRFLFNTKDRQNPLLFMESALTRRILSDEFLLNLLKKSISLKDPKDKIFCIIRKSPSALRYLIKNKNNLPQKRASGVSGINDSLKGELQNDFVEYPELLLEPGLLEDVFNEKESPEIWRRFKVNQIAQYHKLFDIQKLFNQWVIPNEWDLKAKPSFRGRHSFKATFQIKNAAVDNPMHLMIASHRMKLPCRLEETDDFKIEGGFSDNVPNAGSGKISMIEMKFDKPPSDITFPAIARFLKAGDRKYVIEIQNSGSVTNINDYPFLFQMYSNDEPKKENGTFVFQATIKMGLNYDLLDCEQAALLIKAKKEDKIQLSLKFPSNKLIQTKLSNEFVRNILIDYDERFENTIIKLARMQYLLKKKLPWPLYFSANLMDIILSKAIKSKTDAQQTWSDLQQIIARDNKVLSTVSVNVVEDNKIKAHHFYDVVEGIHWPPIKVETNGATDKQIKEVFSDSKQKLEFAIGNIPLSPEATVEFLREKAIKINSKEIPDMNALKHIVTESPEESNTKVIFKWLPEQDQVWYKITPSVICLEKMTWERWLLEADYFAKVKKDHKRAYVASKEALKINPTVPNTAISFGWFAYLCKRVQEAIQVTKQILNDREDYSQFLANINLGLYHLDKLLSSSSKTSSNLESAEQFYKKAISILDKLEEREKVMAIHSAIEDLIENKERLHEIANHYLDMFQKHDEKI
jgi:hypothetical protein